jgi:hypothetical protein
MAAVGADGSGIGAEIGGMGVGDGSGIMVGKYEGA